MRLLPDLQDYIVPFPHKGAELAEDNPHERAGPIEELCRWTVDLSPLPAFQQNAQLAREGNAGGGNQGFYTEFALGLVLDSAEVIGVFLSLACSLLTGVSVSDTQD